MANKSLGTLTLDLIARTAGFVQGMDAAERKSAKWRKQVKKDLADVGAAAKTGLTVIAGAAIAGGTALTAMVVQSAAAAREIKQLSAVAGTSATDFQTAAYGASLYGIEQEKLADILKDTQDKIGDFIQTGGGPLADFFENIAPRVGVTADAFRELSGRDALQLYVDSLEKANLSQSDMTFYMEAIASDSARLIPLLTQNGKLFNELGKQAEDAGIILSDMDFEKLKSAQQTLDELNLRVMSLKNNIAIQFSPVIAGLIEDFDRVAGLIKENKSNIISMAGAVVGAVAPYAVLRTAMLSAALAISAFNSVAKLNPYILIASSVISATTAIIAFSNAQDSATDVWERAANSDAAYEAAKQTISAQNRITKILSERMELTKELNELNESGFKKWSSDGNRAREIQKKLNDLATEYHEITDARINAEKEFTKRREEREAKEREAKKRQIELEESARKAIYDTADSYSSLLGEIDKTQAAYNDYYDIVNRIGAANISLAQKTELITLAFEDLQSNLSPESWSLWLAEFKKTMISFDSIGQSSIATFTSSFGDAFESMILDSQSLDEALRGIAETMLRSVVNAIGQMVAQWIAAAAVQAVIGTSSTAATVAQAGVAGAAWAPAAALASLATLGSNSIPAAAALTSTTALSSTLALTGMAHDGIDSVPQTGTWLLQKGERVMTSQTSDKLDRKLNNMGGGSVVNIYNAPAGTTTNQRTDDIGRTITDVILGDISAGGPIISGITGATGTRRVGR